MMQLWQNIRQPFKTALKITIIIAIGLIAFKGISGYQRILVQGSSMEPTMCDGDIIICIDAWKIEPGDVVVFDGPDIPIFENEGVLWLKRVDHINPENPREYWMLGDNQFVSFDSKNIGYVHRTNIFKKAIYIIKK